MSLEKQLQKEIKTWRGSVLGIGLQENLKEVIQNNPHIEECNLLELGGTTKKGKGTFGKTISIKKIKKYFPKKTYRYIIADYQVIAPYKKTFIRDSIRLSNAEVFFYLPLEIEEDHLLAMYRRYVDAEVIPFQDGKIVRVQVDLATTNWVLDKLYFLVDWLWDLGDRISDLFVS